MKILILSLALLTVSTTSFAGGCTEEKKALAMIDAIKRYEAPVPLSKDEIAEAEQNIRKNEFCVGGLSERLNQLSLCTAVALDVIFAPGQENRMKAKDSRNQARLEKALYEYGKLFPASGESTGFTCDLKKARFKALEND